MESLPYNALLFNNYSKPFIWHTAILLILHVVKHYFYIYYKLHFYLRSSASVTKLKETHTHKNWKKKSLMFQNPKESFKTITCFTMSPLTPNIRSLRKGSRKYSASIFPSLSLLQISSSFTLSLNASLAWSDE